jgi:hypothetical protein
LSTELFAFKNYKNYYFTEWLDMYVLLHNTNYYFSEWLHIYVAFTVLTYIPG